VDCGEAGWGFAGAGGGTCVHEFANFSFVYGCRIVCIKHRPAIRGSPLRYGHGTSAA
jgi:hypothetical protein